MANFTAKTTGMVKNINESIQPRVRHVCDKRSLLQASLHGYPATSTFYTRQQRLYQPNSFISDASLLYNEITRVEQLQTLLLYLQREHQHQQQVRSPALMSRSSRSVPHSTSRNGTGVITWQHYPAGSVTAVRNSATERSINHQDPKYQWLSGNNQLPNYDGHWISNTQRMHREEQQCLIDTIQAQLLYNWYRMWEASDRHGDRWWQNCTDTRTSRRASTSSALQNALFHAFYQLLCNVSDGRYFHPFIHFDLANRNKRPLHTAQSTSRHSQYRAGQLSPASAVSHTLPNGGTALPESINKTKCMRSSIGNNNPLTPFLFVYVPLLMPLSAPQQLPCAANRTACSGPSVRSRFASPFPPRLTPSTRSVDAINNDRLV